MKHLTYSFYMKVLVFSLLSSNAFAVMTYSNVYDNNPYKCNVYDKNNSNCANANTTDYTAPVTSVYPPPYVGNGVENNHYYNTYLGTSYNPNYDRNVGAVYNPVYRNRK